MKLQIFDETYECSKAVKGKDFITLYDDKDIPIVNFSGIVSFDEFKLVEGEWTPYVDKEELLTEIYANSLDTAINTEYLICLSDLV